MGHSRAFVRFGQGRCAAQRTRGFMPTSFPFQPAAFVLHIQLHRASKSHFAEAGAPDAGRQPMRTGHKGARAVSSMGNCERYGLSEGSLQVADPSLTAA